MKNRQTVNVFRCCLYTLLGSCVSAAVPQWPTWRGPGMSGVSPDGRPPLRWSETENIRWKVKLTGDGSNSTPVVWGDKLFFQMAVPTDQTEGSEAEAGQQTERRGPGGRRPRNVYRFSVVCLDRHTGKTLWETVVRQARPHEGHHSDHGFASYSPITDGVHLWANFGSQGLYCLDLDGQLKWKQDFGPFTIRAGFGEGGSPALAGDAVIVLHDHEGDSFIAAVHKETGKILWKKKRDEKTSWTSPLVVEAAGKMQVIVTGHNRTRSYDAKTGDIIWECGGGQTQNVVPTPVTGFGMVFCTSGFRGAKLQAIRLDRTGDLTGTDAVVWEVNQHTPYVPSPLLYEGKLYVFSSNNPVLSCYDAQTGKPYYTAQRLEGLNMVYASPVGAAGRVYAVGRNGTVCVLKNSETLEVLAVNKLEDGFDCSPVIVGPTLYLKGKQNLYCISEEK
ncbi:MAG: PQQ-binding-like beta-propeller repeat protein [Anaerohalosphaeraceae bacterium]